MDINYFATKLGSLLEAPPVKRSAIIPYFLLAVFCQYLVFDLYFIKFPSPYLNLTMVQQCIVINVVNIFICTLMILLNKTFEKSALAQKIVPYIYTQFFIFSLSILGYISGSLSLTTGIVIVAAPMLATILFDKKVLITILISGFIVIAVSNALYLTGTFSYAPLFNNINMVDEHAGFFFVACTAYFATPYLFGMFIFCYFLVSYWRMREAKVRQISLTDPLTGLANRYAISELLIQTLDNAKGASRAVQVIPTSIIMLDMDDFKVINEHYGYSIGDKVLKQVAKILQQHVGYLGHVGRYEGEAFLIVLPNTDYAIAEKIANQCRATVANLTVVDTLYLNINTTASVGVYCANSDTDDIFYVMQQVDIRLYQDKLNKTAL